jgi:cytochrome c553
MIKLKLIITIALAPVALAACGKGAARRSNAEARDTFMRSCAVCHGMTGDGI